MTCSWTGRWRPRLCGRAEEPRASDVYHDTDMVEMQVGVDASGVVRRVVGFI